MTFSYHDEHLIPLGPGHAVSPGWTPATGGRPVAVTWHWTATWDLATCRRLLGGANPLRRGEASAHYAIGRTFAEGVDRYVALENRSWHAGKNQTLRWDGQAYTDPAFKGARTAIGVETVNIGYARDGVDPEDDWIAVWSPDGRQEMRVQPWTEEQLAMMVAVGKEIVARWSGIGVRDHHGHHDLCPGYKVDVAGFPFARVLRGIYDDPAIPDVWTPLGTVRQRRRALRTLGYDPGPAAGGWDRRCDRALEQLQRDHGLVPDGMWTTFVNWKVWELLRESGLELGEVTGPPTL